MLFKKKVLKIKVQAAKFPSRVCLLSFPCALGTWLLPLSSSSCSQVLHRCPWRALGHRPPRTRGSGWRFPSGPRAHVGRRQGKLRVYSAHTGRMQWKLVLAVSSSSWMLLPRWRGVGSTATCTSAPSGAGTGLLHQQPHHRARSPQTTLQITRN